VHVLLQISWQPRPRTACLELGRRDKVSAIFSRQRAPVIYSTVNPKAIHFCPRVTYSVASAAATPESPASTPITLQSSATVVLPMPSELMPHLFAEPVPPDILNPPQLCGMSTPSEPASNDVPPHLQELFDVTLEQCSLSLENQQRLAAVLRRNNDTFAKNSMDIGYCYVLEHDIDTGHANPIKQPPRRPPISARDADDDVLDEMLQVGVIASLCRLGCHQFAWSRRRMILTGSVSITVVSMMSRRRMRTRFLM